MTHLYASVAAGTAAVILTVTLLLLRVSLHRRHVLALTRRWIGASQGTSICVLGPLCTIAACSFASIQLSAPSSFDGASAKTFDAGQALQSLKAYADTVDDSNPSKHARAEQQGSSPLPAVDVLVAKLIARLQDQPNDVAGWKMLGWSYLNTSRPAEAVEAYQTALKLEPGNAEVEKALKAAKSEMSGEVTSTNTVAADTAVSELDAGQNAMIRSMVDQLATRLETSPNDEDGWLQLVRSRMVMKERDAASVALSKALATFKTNAVVSARLTAVARELGIEIPAVQ